MEQSLPADCKEKESPCFASIYGRHVDMLYRLCLSHLKNRVDTEDVVADVFLKLLKSGKTFQSVEHEKAWLLRVAINQCKDHHKHWWNKCESIDEHALLKEDDLFGEDETLKAVLALPERYKAAIYLYYYEGYSSAEIADILKKPRSTILNHLREARNHLKEVLTDEE